MIIFSITQAISSNTVFLKFVDTGVKTKNKKLKWYFKRLKVFSHLSIYCFILKCFCRAQLLWQSTEKYNY